MRCLIDTAKETSNDDKILSADVGVGPIKTHPNMEPNAAGSELLIINLDRPRWMKTRQHRGASQ